MMFCSCEPGPRMGLCFQVRPWSNDGVLECDITNQYDRCLRCCQMQVQWR